jgi:hypothetical protein
LNCTDGAFRAVQRDSFGRLAPCGKRVRRAASAQRPSAPPAICAVAAAAAGRGAGVLHYDRHFDPLCEVLGIESIWIAEPGSFD